MKSAQIFVKNRAFRALLALSLTLPLVGCQQPTSEPSGSATSASTSASTTTSTPATSTMQPLTLTAGSLLPGVGIKEVKVGENRSEVEKSLGAPQSTEPNEFVKGQVYWLYNDKGIELILQEDVVQAVTLHAENNDWKSYAGATDAGIGVSSTAKEVIEKMGPAASEAPRGLTYSDKGIRFLFDVDRAGDGSNARVESIVINAPETEGK